MKHVRAFSGIVLAGSLILALDPEAATSAGQGADAKALGEKFGVIVGPVSEDIRKELNMKKAEGVAVFEVIGDSLAERAGIKVKAVIAEINNQPVRNLEDFARLLAAGLETGNLTIGTWEPARPDDQGATAQMNFHFVPNRVD
jgi:membrane-associated protease RseP (regulator of RpoE activity)